MVTGPQYPLVVLESGPTGQSPPGRPSRWTCRPSPALLHLRCDAPAHLTTLASASGILKAWANPLDALCWMSSSPGGPPKGIDSPSNSGFAGGWIGWLSYDLGRLFEDLPATAPDTLALPLFEFTFHAGATAADLLTGAVRELHCTHPFGDTPLRLPARHRLRDEPLHSNFSRTTFERAVARALDYIAAGDIFQVNLSQRFSVGTSLTPTDIFRALQHSSPAPYGALLDYGDHALISNSPELFLRAGLHRDGSRKVITRPIKGTRPRLPGMDVELLHSPKDQAELNMIVDLERNDLGRVCAIGSVRVTEPRAIEAHPTVYHGVATVEGTLRPDVTFLDLLRATFPGGSVTGAPKIRAMQIIEELEGARRGPYCGAIGYLSANGSAQFNLAIRTIIVKDGLAHIQVGAGIVADSNPDSEYEETLVKARAMFDSLGVGQDSQP